MDSITIVGIRKRGRSRKAKKAYNKGLNNIRARRYKRWLKSLENGIYEVTSTGTAQTPWILTRT